LGAYQQELMAQYGMPFQIVPQVKMLYNPQLKGAYNFVPGVMGMVLILICAMMTSIAIVREKETGTMEILLSSPLKPIYIILAKAVPYFTLSVLNLATILLLAVFMFDVPLGGNLLWLVLLSLLFIFLALSLGLLISTIVDTQLAAMLISGMALMMPIMLLSGMIFTIESMPAILQWISAIVPARWFIEAVKKLMIQGVEVQYVAKEFLILAGMAFFLILVSLKNFKVRLT
jgi:ABC-2 type transport system permease protein